MIGGSSDYQSSRSPWATRVHCPVRYGSKEYTLEVMIEQDTPSKPLRRQRLRVSNACQLCRLRKIKCDGARPGISYFHCSISPQTSCTRLTQTIQHAPDVKREGRCVLMATLPMPLRNRQSVNLVDKHHQFTTQFLCWLPSHLRHLHFKLHQHR